MKDCVEFKINNIKKYIDENICELNNINELTTNFDINRNILHENFKIKFSHSPKEYILIKKMERLTQLIKDSKEDYIVFYYANELGFSSSSALCNFAKRRTGLSFQKFKKSIIKEKV